MRAIGQLQAKGIVIPASEAKRDRVFCAKALLDILEEPARLTPAELPPPVPSPGSKVGEPRGRHEVTER